MLKKSTITIVSGLLSICALNAMADIEIRTTPSTTSVTSIPPSTPVSTTSSTTESLPITSEGQTTTSAADQKKEAEKELPGYNIVFEKSTKKKPDLNNKLIKVQLYKFSKPYKTIQTKTDELGKINFGEEKIDNIGIDLFYIEGQEKLKVQCNGYALPGKMDINVLCE